MNLKNIFYLLLFKKYLLKILVILNFKKMFFVEKVNLILIFVSHMIHSNSILYIFFILLLKCFIYK